MTEAPHADEVRVDYGSIEKSLAELWRGEHAKGDDAVTRAALWNVIAHTWQPRHHSYASEVLSRVAAAVPQRTIIVRAEPDAAPDIAAWISANCHLIGGEKQVCSEEVSIVAGGRLVERVPPLVNALLISDMPVAVWWIGHLPTTDLEYVENLFETAERLIVDSSHFRSVADLALVRRIADVTRTMPADLNWVRLEEWRVATAALFDPPDMRVRLRRIRALRIVSTDEGDAFGRTTQSLLYAAWLAVQAGHDLGAVNHVFEIENHPTDSGSLLRVTITFDGGTEATISFDAERHVLAGSCAQSETPVECVTRIAPRKIDDLLIRQLKRPDADRVFVRTLPIAMRLAS